MLRKSSRTGRQMFIAGRRVRRVRTSWYPVCSQHPPAPSDHGHRTLHPPYVRPVRAPRERSLYRSIFVDVESLVDQIRRWQPVATRILEVGCGEGAVTERLRTAYPNADITAIDITPRVGRLYCGMPGRVRFIQCDVQTIAANEPGRFDLVVLSDVIHHVPVRFRPGLLDAMRTTLAPGGALVFKDWERNYTPIYWLCYASDRWITGDRIAYLSRDEMRGMLSRSFAAGTRAPRRGSLLAEQYRYAGSVLRPECVARTAAQSAETGCVLDGTGCAGSIWRSPDIVIDGGTLPSGSQEHIDSTEPQAARDGPMRHAEIPDVQHGRCNRTRE